MNAGSAIKAVAEMTGFSLLRVANVLGTSGQAINGYVNRSKSMKVDNAVRMLDVMGYDVVFVPRGTKLPKGSVVVTAREESDE